MVLVFSAYNRFQGRSRISRPPPVSFSLAGRIPGAAGPSPPRRARYSTWSMPPSGAEWPKSKVSLGLPDNRCEKMQEPGPRQRVVQLDGLGEPRYFIA